MMHHVAKIDWTGPAGPIWARVCGLPFEEGRRRHLLILRAHIDDSGGKGYSPVIVLAGYLASVERWAEFSLEWRAMLDEVGLPSFHMADVWRLERRLMAKGPLRRDLLLVRAGECIKRHAEHAFIVSVSLDAHEHWMEAPDDRSGLLSARYTALFSLCTMLYQHAYLNHFDKTLEVIFDQGIDGSPITFLKSFDEFRNQAMQHFPGLSVPYPSFLSDNDVLPLQAADYLAWLARRNALNIVRRRNLMQMPEQLLLHEALDMPHKIKILTDKELEPMSFGMTQKLLDAIPGAFDRLPEEIRAAITARMRQG